MRSISIAFTSFLLLYLTACGSCPYSGAAGDCDSAAAILTDDAGGGLCGDVAQSSFDIEQTCEAMLAKDCWIACIEAAGSCDEALDCQDDCNGCD